MKIALDHHYSPSIAAELRVGGHDAIAVSERGWSAEDDERLLTLCHDEQRALLTNNVRDFSTIARRWAAEGRTHSGLIFSSDSSMPRTRKTIDRYVSALDKLLRVSIDETAFQDRIHWL